MRKLLIKITKISLSFITAFSVLTLNFAAFLHCSVINMDDDCCHVTHTVKKCCAKNLKITFNERITSHCGCSVNQSPAASDLYNDLKNSSQLIHQKALINSLSYSEEISSELLKKNYAFYSPPQKYQTDTYLTNLSIRI